MRKSTLLWLLLAAFCGTVLFHTSQKVHDERKTLAALDRAIAREKSSIRVLTAEWGYLNNPGRLQKLADAYLHMAPLKGSQFTRLEDIPLRTASPDPQQPEIITAQKKPAQAENPDGRLASVIRPRLIHVPAPDAPTRFKKRGKDTRKFSEVIKSLRTGVE